VRQLTGVIAALAAVSLVFFAPAALAATRVHHPSVHHPRRHRHAAPWTVRIPAIGVNAPIVALGVNKDGTVGVPSLADVQEVGWYKYGAEPGRPGPTIFLGHVDSYTGPAVFYRLYLIARGDHVYVRAGGRSVTYAITSMRQVSKQAFPSSIYNPGGPPKLYLITCAGAFDYVTRHYDDNIIITARLLTPPAPRPHPHPHPPPHHARLRSHPPRQHRKSLRRRPSTSVKHRKWV
jgi:LPXTG-site transpeptidase (sortase) family protein